MLALKERIVGPPFLSDFFTILKMGQKGSFDSQENEKAFLQGNYFYINNLCLNREGSIFKAFRLGTGIAYILVR